MIKNIIFDLGGVILNLNMQLTTDAFLKLGLDLYNANIYLDFFHDYEIGKITDAEFRARIRKELHDSISEDEIDLAWNAMLLDIPKSRFEVLKQLSKKYNLYLLSNTNNIHITAFYQYLALEHPEVNFSSYFMQMYYSHIMGSRKPNKNCFEKVVTDNDLNIAETLFIDDNLDNINGAKNLGLLAYHALTPIDESIFTTINTLT